MVVQSDNRQTVPNTSAQEPGSEGENTKEHQRSVRSEVLTPELAKTNKEMKAKVIIERGSDGTYDATLEYRKDIPFGLLGQGNTVSETIADFRNSYEEIKGIYAKEEKECPELEFEFIYDVASFLQQYAYAFTLAGLERITGVNQRQLSHYINGVRKPSKATVEKIETRLHNFGNEISAVRFV